MSPGLHDVVLYAVLGACAVVYLAAGVFLWQRVPVALASLRGDSIKRFEARAAEARAIQARALARRSQSGYVDLVLLGDAITLWVALLVAGWGCIAALPYLLKLK